MYGLRSAIQAYLLDAAGITLTSIKPDAQRRMVRSYGRTSRIPAGINRHSMAPHENLRENARRARQLAQRGGSSAG